MEVQKTLWPAILGVGVPVSISRIHTAYLGVSYLHLDAT